MGMTAYGFPSTLNQGKTVEQLGGDPNPAIENMNLVPHTNVLQYAVINTKKKTDSATGTGKSAPMVPGPGGDGLVHFNKIDAMYETMHKTAENLRDVRHETDLAKRAGHLTKRGAERSLPVHLEPKVGEFQPQMSRMYGGSANMTADRYIK